MREVREECGIKGHRIVKPLPPSYHTYSWEGISYLKKTNWYLMDYDGIMITEPQKSDEISKIKGSAWLSLMELIYSTILRS